MCQNKEELTLLEIVSKGRRVRTSQKLLSHFNSDKYKYYQRSFKGQGDFHTPSTSEMVHTAIGKTQAIFKISSFGKGTKRIATHLSYISRYGRLELEDQNGNKIVTTKEQKVKLENWAIDFGDGERSRNTMQIVLSTPPGTHPDNALEAAKEFFNKEFKQSGHEYLFVLHNYRAHPHIHAVIKMVSCYGNKINPRKAYLHRVRQHFATICRSHGIQVEASSRAERGLLDKSLNSKFIHMRRRRQILQVNSGLANGTKHHRNSNVISLDIGKDKIEKRNQIIRKRYVDKARDLVKKANRLNEKGEKDNCIQTARLLHKHSTTIGVSKEHLVEVQLEQMT